MEDKTAKDLADVAEILGLDREDLINRVVDRIAESATASLSFKYNEDDDEDDEDEVSGHLARQLKRRVQAAIDRSVDRVAEETIVPKAEDLIRGFVLHETNRWGKSVTFVEYIVARADAWLNEEKGKDSYRWSNRNPWARIPSASSSTESPPATRLGQIIDSHLKYSLETTMKKIMEKADESVKGRLKTLGLDAVKLGEVKRKRRDQRKAAYAAALHVWRKKWKTVPGRKPSASSFGLSVREAQEIEHEGYDTSDLPAPLRPGSSES